MAYIEDRWLKEPARKGFGKRWRVRWRDPQGKPRSRSFEQRAQADKYLTKLKHDLLAQTYTDPALAKGALSQIAETWYEGRAPNLKRSTRDSYRRVLDRHVLPTWGDVPLGAIRHTDCYSWVGDLTSAGASASTVRHAYYTLSAILDLAVTASMIPANPVRGVPMPSLPPKKRHRYLTHAEALRLAMAAGEQRALIMTLAYCGLRWSEMVGLQAGDLDVATRRIIIDRAFVEVGGVMEPEAPKNWRARMVPVPQVVLDALTVPSDPTALLLPSPDKGMWLRTSFRRSVWLPAIAGAGLAHLRVHDLRHTAASLAVSSGANVLAIARMLGHDPKETLNRYADLFDSDLDAVARLMDESARKAWAFEM